MPRSTSTALYTRVDNSFSNPVVGTTISPTHADSFFDDVESAVNAFIATSASSVAIGTGSKSFTVASDVANKVFIAGTFVHIYSRADTADYMFGTVTSYSTSTGVLVVDVTATGGSGTNTDWNIYQAGARGATGATGTTGSTGGIRQAYSTTTADADPGAGTFRLNNATPASATAAYLDDVDAGGATVSTIFDLWDDSGSTVRGFIRFEKSSDATVWAQFQVTGSVVDGTGYRKLTLTNGAGSGAFTDGDTFSIVFYRTGDPGALGGSTGATDNAIIRADGTGGATVQNSAVSIDDSGNITGATTIDIGNADTTLSRASAGTLAVEGVNVLTTATGAAQGKQTIWIPAAAMTSRSTNGAASGTAEMTTNKNMFKTLDFDTTTQEFAQFEVFFPKSWNLSTVTFRALWSHAATVTNFGVVWSLAGVARSDDDAGDVAFGSSQTSTDTGGTTNDIYVSPESSAITIAGTPASGDSVQFQLDRAVSNGSDTLGVDARLHGIQLFFTTNASTDA